MRAAADFVWSIRNHLHYHAGRRSDRLTFEEQESIARAMGYRTLHLDTSVNFLPAQRLYQSAGYKETHRGRLGEFDCIFFEKTLDDSK